MYLRLSVPVLNRLSTILDSVTDVNLLRLLQTEVCINYTCALCIQRTHGITQAI